MCKEANAAVKNISSVIISGCLDGYQYLIEWVAINWVIHLLLG